MRYLLDTDWVVSFLNGRRADVAGVPRAALDKGLPAGWQDYT